MGGEKKSSRCCTSIGLGSPPHRRGKGPGSGAAPSSGRDHPRVGGEKPCNRALGWGGIGSPPRGRGKVPAARYADFHPGITPAWAGKSIPFSRYRGIPRDHPRVGGEKVLLPHSRQPFWGSPPHGRGKGHVALAGVLVGRITPAQAGKSGPGSCTGRCCGDHPPHRRGKARQDFRTEHRPGITPA